MLPSPRHFEQAAELVTPEMTRESQVCGPDIDRHVEAMTEYVDAGYDEVYTSQIGAAGKDFFRWAADELLPRLREG